MTGENLTGRWTDEEHEVFVKGIEEFGRDWKRIQGLLRTRTLVQIRTHAQKYFKKLAKESGGSSSIKKDTQVPIVKDLLNCPKITENASAGTKDTKVIPKKRDLNEMIGNQVDEAQNVENLFASGLNLLNFCHPGIGKTGHFTWKDAFGHVPEKSQFTLDEFSLKRTDSYSSMMMTTATPRMVAAATILSSLNTTKKQKVEKNFQRRLSWASAVLEQCI